MAFFDIVIPCGGKGTFLFETIDSVMQQSFSDFRIILFENSNGGHTCEEVCRQFADDRISIVRSESRVDMIKSSQHCIMLATSPWAVVLHDDDIWSQNVLESTRRIIESSCATGVLCRWEQCEIHHGEPQLDPTLNREYWQKLNGLDQNLRNLFLTTTSGKFHMSAMFFRTSNRLGMHPTSLWNFDSRFGHSISRFGRLMVNDEPWVYVRKHDNSLTRLTSDPRGMGGFENCESARDGLISILRYDGGFDVKSFKKLLDSEVPSVFWRELLRVCFSWPLRVELEEFGRLLCTVPEVRREISRTGKFWSLMNNLPISFWVLADIACKYRYYLNERSHKKSRNRSVS